MQEKLKSISEQYTGGGTPPTKRKEFWDGDIPWIQSSDISKDKLFDVKPEKFITKEAINSSSAQIIKKEAISIVTRVGVGKVAYIPFEFSTSQDFLSLQKLLIDSNFGAYLVKLLMEKLSLQTQGTSIKGITNKQLLNSDIKLPKSWSEQEKIGRMIRTLDSTITLEQEKIKNINTLKEHLLQKIFPKKGHNIPEWRFNNYNNKWIKTTLNELGNIHTGNTPKTSNEEYYTNNGIPWVTPTDINKMKVTKTGRSLSKYGSEVARIVPKGSILVTSIASIGKNALAEEELGFNQQINALVPFQENDSYFLFVQSKFWSDYMKLIASTGTMQIINKTEFSKLNAYTTSFEEQQKVGKFFKKINTLIDTHNKKITALENSKNILLKNLFV